MDKIEIRLTLEEISILADGAGPPAALPDAEAGT